jgi:hypothetical protein
MPALALSDPVPASLRNPDSPADQALAKIVDLLLPAGYGFTIPAEPSTQPATHSTVILTRLAVLGDFSASLEY